MFDWIADPNAWIALATLTALEIVLGIDNIIFISILVSRVPPDKRDLARRLGLSLAMVSRILLLLSLAWIMRLTEPLFSTFGHAWSGRDMILIGGGLFLLWKSVHEIHNSLEGEQDDSAGGHAASAARAGFAAVLVQIAVIDIVFSLDSVITAVGLADDVMVMVIAIVAAVGVMMFAAKSIGDFVDAPPDDQDAGAGLPGAGRRDAGRRGLRHPCAQGLHLLRDGLLVRRRDDQHPPAQAFDGAGAAAQGHAR